MSSSSSSPCAACKFLRRKCTSSCIFAPYFPPEQPTKFANVHNVFGASNVSKILQELPVAQREVAVNSLSYEAEARIRDPVLGCMASVYNLQNRIKQVQTELEKARKELSAYMGDAAFKPFFPPYVPQFTNNEGVQVNLAEQQIVIKEEEQIVIKEEQQIVIKEEQHQPQYDMQHQPQYDMQQQMAPAMEAEAVPASEQERMIEADVGGSGTVYAGLGLGNDDVLGIGSSKDLQIQEHPQYMHQNLYEQQHDDAMNDDGRSG